MMDDGRKMFFSGILLVCLVCGLGSAANPLQLPLAEPDSSLAFSVQVDGHTFVNKVRVENILQTSSSFHVYLRVLLHLA